MTALSTRFLRVPRKPRVLHCLCCSRRCIRRAFLCGFDQQTGKDFEHRRQWIEDRIFKLAESFAVSVYAYAVMSNHCHVVLRSDPRVSWQWSDREVAERWLAVFPGSISNRDDPACVEKATLALLGEFRTPGCHPPAPWLDQLVHARAQRADCPHGQSRGRLHGDDSGKDGSSARRCSTSKRCCLAWPTSTSIPSGPACARRFATPSTLPSGTGSSRLDLQSAKRSAVVLRNRHSNPSPA